LRGLAIRYADCQAELTFAVVILWRRLPEVMKAPFWLIRSGGNPGSEIRFVSSECDG
jgi:hypothetical protein